MGCAATKYRRGVVEGVGEDVGEDSLLDRAVMNNHPSIDLERLEQFLEDGQRFGQAPPRLSAGPEEPRRERSGSERRAREQGLGAGRVRDVSRPRRAGLPANPEDAEIGKADGYQLSSEYHPPRRSSGRLKIMVPRDSGDRSNDRGREGSRGAADPRSPRRARKVDGRSSPPEPALLAVPQSLPLASRNGDVVDQMLGKPKGNKPPSKSSKALAKAAKKKAAKKKAHRTGSGSLSPIPERVRKEGSKSRVKTTAWPPSDLSPFTEQTNVVARQFAGGGRAGGRGASRKGRRRHVDVQPRRAH